MVQHHTLPKITDTKKIAMKNVFIALFLINPQTSLYFNETKIRLNLMKNIKLILISFIVVSNLAIAQMNLAYNKLNPELPSELQLPSPEPYQQRPKVVNSYNIHQLFEQYQQRATKLAAVKDDYVATFDLLMDKDMVVEGLQLNEQLEKAIKAKISINEFEALGLSQQTINNKTFTIKQSIHFKDPMIALFRISNSSAQQYLSNQLNNRGFRKSDLKVLFQFINQINPMRYADKYTVEYILPQIPNLKLQFKNNELKKEDIYHTFNNELTYFNTFTRVRLWRQWTLNLLEQFQPQQQRALKSLIIEYLKDEQSTHTQFIEDPSIIDTFAQKVLSGAYEQQQKTIYRQYVAEVLHK